MFDMLSVSGLLTKVRGASEIVPLGAESGDFLCEALYVSPPITSTLIHSSICTTRSAP